MWTWDNSLEGYTSALSDDLTCPTCDGQIKYGLQTCEGCNSYINTFTINREGATDVICRMVESRPEAVLASSQKRSQRILSSAQEQSYEEGFIDARAGKLVDKERASIDLDYRMGFMDFYVMSRENN